MKSLGIIMALLFAGSVHAETKVMKLGKVHCQDCVATLKEKICTGSDYQTCEVKLINKKKELGELKLVTKGDAKIDMAKVTKIVEDEGYTIKK